MRNSKGEKVRKRLIKRRGAGRRGERKGNTHSAMGLHLHIVPSPNITNGHPCCRSSNWPRVRRGEVGGEEKGTKRGGGYGEGEEGTKRGGGGGE